MAPSTPPPPSSEEFAAFTIASQARPATAPMLTLKCDVYNKTICAVLNSNCSPLTITSCWSIAISVSLPSTIRFVGYSAFAERYGDYPCKTLSSITIPDSVSRICFSANAYTNSSWNPTDVPEQNNCFAGTNFNLATQNKLRQLGYDGEF